jgi:hypothetical protein
MRIDYSAYPTTEEHMNGGAGLSVRELAAIQLRVPDSGDEKIDAMIRQANRRDFAGQALAGLLADESTMGYESCAAQAVKHADALIEELNR